MKRFFAFLLMFGLICGAGAVTVGCKKDPPKTTPAAADSKLALTAPKSVEIAQDNSAKLKISVERTKFDGPVTITVKDLPKGVTAEKDLTIAKGETQGEVTLKADATAAVVADHAAKVEASGGGLTATETTKVSVKAK